VTGKYAPLGAHLRERAAQGERQVELGFGAVDRLVGGLPPSARSQRTWWANNSHGQALAWRDAGWHVHAIDFPGQRVTFVTGQFGGSYADRKEADVTAATPARSIRAAAATLVTAELPPPDTVTVSVSFTWRDAGAVTLDGTGKPSFPPLPEVPGMYRLTLTGPDWQSRARVYIGETDNLRRRLAGNYRNPGPSQQTSQRVNALLRDQLTRGGTVALAVTTDATTTLEADSTRSMDLTRKAGRLLVENAALVLAQVTDDADIENLG
jgi:hypothetical protein